jgi:hypothetical protein
VRGLYWRNVGLLIVLVVAVVFSIFLARIEFRKLEKSGDLPPGWGGYLASILNAVQIQVMSRVYNKMAVTMTDYGTSLPATDCCRRCHVFRCFCREPRDNDRV